jgi:hypothetical protein
MDFTTLPNGYKILDVTPAAAGGQALNDNFTLSDQNAGTIDDHTQAIDGLLNTTQTLTDGLANLTTTVADLGDGAFSADNLYLSAGGKIQWPEAPVSGFVPWISSTESLITFGESSTAKVSIDIEEARVIADNLTVTYSADMSSVNVTNQIALQGAATLAIAALSGAGTRLLTVGNSGIVGASTLGTAAAVNTGTTSGTIPLLTTGGQIPSSMLSNYATSTSVGTSIGTLAGTVAATYATKANNLSDLASASTARTNLGLGTAATANTGTTSGTIPLLSTGGKLPASLLDLSSYSTTSAINTALALKAPLASPTFSGNVWASGILTVGGAGGGGGTVSLYDVANDDFVDVGVTDRIMDLSPVALQTSTITGASWKTPTAPSAPTGLDVAVSSTTGTLDDYYEWAVAAFKDGMYSEASPFYADYATGGVVFTSLPTPPAGTTYYITRYADGTGETAIIGSYTGTTFTDNGLPNGDPYVGGSTSLTIGVGNVNTPVISTNGNISATTVTVSQLGATNVSVSTAANFYGNVNLQGQTTHTRFYSGTANSTGLNLSNQYNTGGTASGTDLTFNRTHYGVGSGQQNFIDAKLGGTSRFRLDTSGNVFSAAGCSFATSMYMGGNTSTLTATPLVYDMGGTYGNSTAGSVSNLKLKVYNATGSNQFGFGVSASRFEYQVPSGVVHSLYVAGAEKLQVNGNGLIVGPNGTNSTYWGTPTIKVRHASGTRTLLQMYSPDDTKSLPFYIDNNGDFNIGGIGGNGTSEAYNIGGGDPSTSTFFGSKVLKQGFTYANARRVNEIVRRDETAGKTGTPNLTEWQQANTTVMASVDYSGKATFAGLTVSVTGLDIPVLATTPAAPPVGFVRLYAKSSGSQIVALNSDNEEIMLGEI